MSESPPRFRLFAPILAGATLKERAVACLGALLGIAATALLCRLSLGSFAPLPFIVAPMGASAVLLFAVPASPLAQPWPIIGGNTISAAAGIAMAKLVHDPAIAAGLAVGLAIAVMSLTRTLHPPGGAAALTAVIGGPAVAAAGFQFALMPVALNSALLVALGLAFHRATGRSYPHRPHAPPQHLHKTADAPSAMRVGFTTADIDAALTAFNETLDIEREDLDLLLREVEQRALERQHGELTCADIMSRDVIAIAPGTTPDEARALLLDHDIRTLPVLDAQRKVLGTVGLRELAHMQDDSGLPITPAVQVSPQAPAVSLIPKLNDGRTHAALVVNAAGVIEGIISQTDLLAALARSLSNVKRG